MESCLQKSAFCSMGYLFLLRYCLEWHAISVLAVYPNVGLGFNAVP